MTVWVDDARMPLGRMLVCHMLADTLDELHAVAEAIGMRRSWYQPTSFPHYDVAAGRRARAIALGAVPVDRAGVVAVKRRLRADPAWVASVVAAHDAEGLPRPRFATG